MSFFRSLFGNTRNNHSRRPTNTQPDEQIQIPSLRDLVSSSATSLLNKLTTNTSPSVEEIRLDMLNNLLHKHTIPYKQGRIVLLWKERTTYEEYQEYLHQSLNERTIMPSQSSQGGKSWYGVDVILPFVVPDVKTSPTVANDFKGIDMNLSNLFRVDCQRERFYFLRGINVKVTVNDENFYFIYEGVAQLPITNAQTMRLQRQKVERFSDVYNVTFKTGNDGKIFARTEEVYSPVFLRYKDYLVELLMFKLWVFSKHGFGLNTLWMFSALIFHYSFTTVLLLVLAFAMFRDSIASREYVRDKNRKYMDQERTSRNNLETLFKEMVYVGTQELAY